MLRCCIAKDEGLKVTVRPYYYLYKLILHNYNFNISFTVSLGIWLLIILKVLERNPNSDISNPESSRDSILVAIAHLAKDRVIASELEDTYEAYQLLCRFFNPSGKWGENPDH